MTSRPIIALFAAAALGVGAFAAAPAHATVFNGSITLTDETSDNLTVTGGGSIKDLSLTTLNTWTEVDSIISYSLIPSKSGVYNDNILAQFTFDSPSAAEPYTGGSGNAYDAVIKGVFSAGAITWNQPNPLTIDFATGDEIKIELLPGVFGQFGSNNMGDLSIKIEQTKVPEPMSLSLLGAGLAALGVASRRRPRAMAATA